MILAPISLLAALSRTSKAALFIGQSNAGEIPASALAAMLSNDRFFAQICRGGVSISTWINDDYTATATLISDLATFFEGKQFTDVDFVLFHGESDASALLAPKHRLKVAALIRHVRDAVGAEVVRAVFILPWKKGASGIAEGYQGVTSNPTGAGDIVRAGLVALAEENPLYRTIDSRLWERAYSETGTVSATNNTITLNGVGTTWRTDGIYVGQSITVAGQIRTVASVPSNTVLTVTANWTPAIPGGTAIILGDAVHVTSPGFIGDNFPNAGSGSYPNRIQEIVDLLRSIP